MGTTPNLKLPIPELTEAADGPHAFSDLALATEGYFYNRTLPAGVVRSPSYYWGRGTAFPTTGMVTGDTYYHSALGLHFYDQSAAVWVQASPLRISSMSARPPINTTGLYAGFRVKPLDRPSLTYVWDGSVWMQEGLLQFGGSTVPAGAYITKQEGTAVVSTANGVGGFGLMLPFAYSATPLYAAMVPGDSDGNPFFIMPMPNNYTANALNGTARGLNNSNPPVGALYRITYMALGYNL